MIKSSHLFEQNCKLKKNWIFPDNRVMNWSIVISKYLLIVYIDSNTTTFPKRKVIFLYLMRNLILLKLCANWNDNESITSIVDYDFCAFTLVNATRNFTSKIKESFIYSVNFYKIFEPSYEMSGIQLKLNIYLN